MANRANHYEAALEASMRAYEAAGVDELAFLPVGVGSDPQRSVVRTWDALAGLIPGGSGHR